MYHDDGDACDDDDDDDVDAKVLVEEKQHLFLHIQHGRSWKRTYIFEPLENT